MIVRPDMTLHALCLSRGRRDEWRANSTMTCDRHPGFFSMQLHQFDLGSQAYKRNPYPTLARMVEQGPVVRVKFPLIGKLWMATNYAAVDELLRERQIFVREPRSAGLTRRATLPWWLPRSMQALAESMVNRDEPDHRRLRALVEHAFLRCSVDELRPRFEAMLIRCWIGSRQSFGATASRST
jgi:cytochrome P450